MIVQTDKGKIEGTTRDGVTVFKGVPYAAPPVAELRWKPPKPAHPWSGVRKADSFSKACIQPVFASMDGMEPVGEQSEDCLYLNVWTPGGGEAHKPVMVWIHGGAFQIGSGTARAYDGTPLARKGAVVVTLNYRLGHLGFFAHPALEAEAPNGPVNFGLLDQIAALQWVQRNIAAFGGDPGNVTIFGQSAGAMSVLALFCSPLASNLFHKGIAQSPYAIPEHSRDTAIERGASVASLLLKVRKHPTAADLRRIKPEMFAIHEIVNSDGSKLAIPSLAPVPVIGDPVLRMRIRDTFDMGKQLALPLILGSTSGEQSILEAFKIPPQSVIEMIEASPGGPEAIAYLKSLYQHDPELDIPDDLNNPQRFGGLVLRDCLFTMQVRWLAEKHSERADARRYYFSYEAEALGAMPHGVPHGGELVFPFGTGGTVLGTERFTKADREMVAKVSNYWFTFAQTGTPEGPPAWQRHLNPLTDRILKLGTDIANDGGFRITRLQTYAAMYPLLFPVITPR